MNWPSCSCDLTPLDYIFKASLYQKSTDFISFGILHSLSYRQHIAGNVEKGDQKQKRLGDSVKIKPCVDI